MTLLSCPVAIWIFELESKRGERRGRQHMIHNFICQLGKMWLDDEWGNWWSYFLHIFSLSRKWSHTYLSTCSRDVCLLTVPTNTLHRDHTWLSTTVVSCEYVHWQNWHVGQIDWCGWWVLGSITQLKSDPPHFTACVTSLWIADMLSTTIDWLSFWIYWLRVHYLTGVMCAQWFDQWCGRAN